MGIIINVFPCLCFGLAVEKARVRFHASRFHIHSTHSLNERVTLHASSHDVCSVRGLSLVEFLRPGQNIRFCIKFAVKECSFTIDSKAVGFLDQRIGLRLDQFQDTDNINLNNFKI